MSQKRALVLIAVLVVLVFGLGSFWWWALFGMTHEVAVACAVTATVGVITLLVGVTP